jgi:hypothetical protein
MQRAAGVPDGVPYGLAHRQVDLQGDRVGDSRLLAYDRDLQPHVLGHGGFGEHPEGGPEPVLQLLLLQPLELGGDRAGLVQGQPRGLAGEPEPLLGPLWGATAEGGEELQGLVGHAHVVCDAVVELAAYALPLGGFGAGGGLQGAQPPALLLGPLALR